MGDAVASYAKYLTSPDSDFLGRFIVPAARLDEFAAAAESDLPRGDASTGWQLSVLAGHDAEAAREGILEFNASHARNSPRGHATCDTVEAVTQNPAEVDHIVDCFRDSFRLFIEVPIDSARTTIPLIAEAGIGAKIRTGGVTRGAFPKPEDVGAFMSECHRAGVAFKATAGLHHPLRAEFPLTYEADAERAPMFGYLNLFIAAATIITGDGDSVVEALTESDPRSIAVDDSHLKWRSHRFSRDDLREVRERFFLSFGSCSFEEPIGEARAMGLLT
jgi:hypothetical protein